MNSQSPFNITAPSPRNYFVSENGIAWEQRWRALNLSDWRYWLTLGVIGAIYFEAAKFGLSLAFVDKQVKPVTKKKMAKVMRDAAARLRKLAAELDRQTAGKSG